MELSLPRSIGAFSPRPDLVSLLESECCTHGGLVASQRPLTAVPSAGLRVQLGQALAKPWSAGPVLEHVLQHLVRFTGSSGIAQQRLLAGEGLIQSTSRIRN